MGGVKNFRGGLNPYFAYLENSAC